MRIMIKIFFGKYLTYLDHWGISIYHRDWRCYSMWYVVCNVWLLKNQGPFGLPMQTIYKTIVIIQKASKLCKHFWTALLIQSVVTYLLQFLDYLPRCLDLCIEY